MRIFLFNKNKLSKLMLPTNLEGSFWLTDDFNDNANIINIESNLGKWILKENDEAKIIFENKYVSSLEIKPNKFYFIDYNGSKLFLYAERILDRTIKYYKVSQNTELNFGKDDTQDIMYNNEYFYNEYFKLIFKNNVWEIEIKQNSRIYINNYLLMQQHKILNYGDTLFVLGMKITLYNGMLSINNPSYSVTVKSDKLLETKFKILKNNEKIIDSDQIKEVDLYKEEDYFYKKPRLRRFIEEYDLKMAQPPSKPEQKDMPLILTLGPAITMGIISGVMLVNNIIRILSGQSTLLQAIPQLISSIAMLLSSLLWPNLTKRYNKKMQKKKEKERQEKYREYISKKQKEVYDVGIDQAQILKENLISVEECENIILKSKRNLWERRNDQQDFMTVRVGIGKVPLKLSVNFNEDEFTMEEDELKKEAEKIINDSKILHNVPVSYSFYNKRVTALMGNQNEIFSFVDNLLLQLFTFHSYDDLKIVFFVSNNNVDIWKKYKEVPYLFSDNKQVRFFATDLEDIKSISSYLEQEFNKRFASKGKDAVENENKEKTYSPYYLIITDDYPMIRKIGIIDNILKNKDSYGFSIAIIENRLGKLPSECVNYISLVGQAAILSTDIDDYYQQDFIKEINPNLKIDECCKVLSNIPIEFSEDLRNLPTSLGFLEMYNVGKMEQLNILNRWRINDPVMSLRAQIGINDQGNSIYLDLHEKYHGPHGLIAGTTGSGKSEFIITYILSMAVNYSPNEVAFILIDYKGGGLAGAFENKIQGIRLPHLAGTITNLDKASLNRTLVSINSELKRRQEVFNTVRDKLGESTIDIYKYQKFFREGKIDEPMPHLFIISDEFAELKSQQPEFMADLISAARIGRSLGIHLILATQKPSGVVNDQIWSNSKFKVCLKVQDKSDSNEMLKCPDAAEITNPGRFFLQVGNNEIFVLGQSGWAGMQYFGTDSIKKKYDRSISFINDIGAIIKSLENVKEVSVSNSKGDELTNIVKYICTLANKENIKAKNLWLESIPEDIYVDDIIRKYNYSSSDIITAVIGEYDAPAKQIQNILTLKLDEEGNTLIYGTSGSNREMFLSTLIYSLCISYMTEDINLYILDFGSESLRIYEKFPQVGDIVYSNEKDKLNKFFSIINEEIKTRKKIFVDYNGEYKNYIKNSGKKMPLKIIIFNNYDSFKENYASLEENLVKFTREGARYGILFIIAASSSRCLYSRVSRNFHNVFTLDMQDKGDYIDLLGKIGNVYPADYNGRGLFKSDAVYEYQTAKVSNAENLYDFIKNSVNKVSKKCTSFAPKIPELPELLTIQDLNQYITNVNNLPLGINKDTLKPSFYNFFRDKATVICSKKVSNCIDLLETIIYSIRKLGHMVIVIDGEQELASIGKKANNYADSNFEEFILEFEKFLDKEIENNKNIKVLCVLCGFEKLKQKMDEKKLNGFFKGCKYFENLSLIIVGSNYQLKKIVFESWYSNLVNNTNGIWIGSGFTEQSIIKISGYGAKFREQIDKQFAWVTKLGESDLIKIVGEKEKEDEE